MDRQYEITNNLRELLLDCITDLELDTENRIQLLTNMAATCAAWAIMGKCTGADGIDYDKCLDKLAEFNDVVRRFTAAAIQEQMEFGESNKKAP